MGVRDTSGGDATVAVIGAGVAGLVAARELERLGHRVAIFEADDRVGGRVFTHRFPGNEQVELGAMRIPRDHAATMRYVHTLGLADQLRPFGNILSDKANLLWVEGRALPIGSATASLISRAQRQTVYAAKRRESLLFGGWLLAAVDALGPQELRRTVATDVDEVIRAADRVDLRPFVRGKRIDLGAAIAAHPQLERACRPRLRGFLHDLAIESSQHLLTLRGGMSQLTDKMAAQLCAPIHVGHQVLRIDNVQKGVRIVVVGPSGRASLLFSAVVCTIPFSVLRHMPVTGVDDDKHLTIAQLDYGSGTKVAMRTRSAFWIKRGIRGGGSSVGGRIRQTYYPTLDHKYRGSAALLASYTIAEDADVLGRMPEHERHRTVLEELATVHPEIGEDGMVLDMVSVAWGQRKWHRGCAARRWGLTDAQLRAESLRASRAQGRLFFAGEHCHPHPAWVDAGITSALNTTQQLNAQLPPAVPAEDFT